MCPTVDCVWTLQFSRLIFSTAWMRTNQFLVAISTSSTSNVRAAKRYMEGLQTGLDSSFRCACMQSGCGYARYIVSDSRQAWWSLSVGNLIGLRTHAECGVRHADWDWFPTDPALSVSLAGPGCSGAVTQITAQGVDTLGSANWY